MNDGKIKYIDLNGLQYFAEELKRYLESHVMEYSIYGELLERIQNLETNVENYTFYEVIESYDKLLELDNPQKNIIYLVPDDNNFLEYIWADNKYEQLGSFTPELKLDDYLKKEDSPFEKGQSENSAVLKGGYQGYSNKAISQTSMAVGAGTTAGLKGWYYRDYEGRIIEILTTQPTLQNGRLVGGTLANGSDVEKAFKVGDVISLVNHQKYDRYAKVINVQGNQVMLDYEIRGKLSAEVTINDIDDWSIFLPDKPHLGAVDFGFGAFSEGGMSKSTNVCSHAEGFATEAYGQFSHTEGKETEAAYAAHAEGVKTKATGNDAHAEGHITTAKGDHSHAEGRETVAEGYAAHAEGLYSIAGVGSRPSASTVNDAGRYAHAEGNGTQASGNSAHSEGKHTLASGNFSHSEGFNTEATFQCAHAEGSGTTASGSASHAEGINTIADGRASHSDGLGTITNNESEHACGRYNKSTKSGDKAQATQFSIGIGTSDADTDRKNAIEVKQNGDVYITGIGGFTGDNSSSSKSVQEVINELVNKLNEITTND